MKKEYIFIALLFLIFGIILGLLISKQQTASYETVEEVNNTNQQVLNEEEPPWNTYSNPRFMYTIKYPSGWIPGKVAENNDGLALYQDEEGNEILVYGTNTPSGFSTQGNHLARELITLNDGTKATFLKTTDLEGKFYINIIVTTDDQQFVLNATGNEGFIADNEELIKKVGKTLSIKNK